MSKTLNVTLKVWRQDGPDDAGRFETYELARGISDEASFLEMLDQRQRAAQRARARSPITFDHDCREGICGTCSLMIDGQAHGPERGTATCQLHMRKFTDGATITVEPWRAEAFPIVKDLMVDRAAVRPHRRGGRVHHRPDRLARPTPTSSRSPSRWPTRPWTRRSASGAAPAWRPARTGPPTCSRRPRWPTSTCCRRASPSATGGSRRWSTTMEQYFGSCTNHGECEAACPKTISIDFIALDEPGLPGRPSSRTAASCPAPAPADDRLTPHASAPARVRCHGGRELASDAGGSGTLPAVAAGEPALTGFDRAYRRLGERQARQLMDDVRDSPERAVAPGERAAAFLVACGVHLVTAGLVVGGVVLVVATWFNAVGLVGGVVMATAGLAVLPRLERPPPGQRLRPQEVPLLHELTDEIADAAVGAAGAGDRARRRLQHRLRRLGPHASSGCW